MPLEVPDVHKAKVAMAKSAIQEVYSDTSVPLQQTLESLEEIQADLNELIFVVKDDIENQE